MKKPLVFFLIIFFILNNFVYSQSFFDIPKKQILDHSKLVITYMLEYKQDSTVPDDIRAEEMVLFIGDSISLFMSYNKAVNDSLMEKYAGIYGAANNIDGFTSAMSASRLTTRFMYQIFKNYPAQKISTIDVVFSDRFLYEEPHGTLNWTIHSEEQGARKKMLGYELVKATTRFAGRTWIAWFAPQIPISDGPYKFHGLPGLILYLQDSKSHYVFTLTSIEKPEPTRTITLQLANTTIKVSKAQFMKLQQEFRQNFIIRAQEAQLAPESQRIASENMRRRNNPIELKAD